MPQRHYVIAIRLDRATKRLCGPFERMQEASAITARIGSIIADDPEYRHASVRTDTMTISAKDLKAGKRFPHGAIDPARIDLAGVIAAATRHKVIWYDR